jgi:integrase
MRTINTASQVATAEPGVHRVGGATGLYLKKSANGGSWVWRYRLDGARRWMGLGSTDKVSLAGARRQAQELRLKRDKGVDPIGARKRERAEIIARERAEAKKTTFAQAAQSYLEAHGPSWKHRYARAIWWNPVRDYALPIIGDLLLDDIRVEHVVAVMRGAEKAGVKETARRVRARIERVLNAAGALGHRDLTRQNPADAKLIAHAHPLKRRGERAHYRRCALDDAPAVFLKLLSGAQNSTMLAAWVFMVLTAARPSEAFGAQWGEIDLDRRLWTVPAARMKSARKHVVPLSSLALVLLERHARVRTGDAVFPGRSGSPSSYPVFATAPTKACLDAGTPHSWRSVFRDACGDRLRIDRDLAEAALSHTLGAVEGAYRRETAIEARRPVMEAYAKWLEGEPSDNVVAFPARA